MASGRKGLVLLAEDDPDQVEVLEEVLTQEGYRLLVAKSPQDVLRLLGQRPEVILLDLVGVSNPEVFEAIRQAAWRPAVLLVSGDAAVAQTARQMGAQGYLSKPFDLEQLTGEIERALAARSGDVEAGEWSGR